MFSRSQLSVPALLGGGALLAGGVAFGWLVGFSGAIGFAEPRSVSPRDELSLPERRTVELFNAARESVVSISTAQRIVDPWTRRVENAPAGTGSGFVWDEVGHIVTNDHVIRGASGALVRLADGRAFRAALVGTAPSHDLAVLRIDIPDDAPAPLPLGSSADLQVGQSVLAIGNPFGLDWTLTTGVVSALDREIPGRRGAVLRGLVQTDAAINPGNSGGPLIDSAGRLIGVNTAIFSNSGSSAGIGFAVPVDTVNRVVPQLIARGRYAPPVLGVSVDARADALLRRDGVAGAMILGVAQGSAADRAGLRAAALNPDGSIRIGDVIIAVGETRIESSAALSAALDGYAAGDAVTIVYLRDGEARKTQVRLDRGR